MEADKEKLVDYSLRWKNAAELSVKAGDVETLRGLLRGGRGGQDESDTAAAQLYSQIDSAGLNILLMELDPAHTACAAGHREIVQLILTEVAPWSVMGHDKDCGATALHMAARFGRVEIARDLLGYGALVCSRDRGGCTPRKRATTFSSSWLVYRDTTDNQKVLQREFNYIDISISLSRHTVHTREQRKCKSCIAAPFIPLTNPLSLRANPMLSCHHSSYRLRARQ